MVLIGSGEERFRFEIAGPYDLHANGAHSGANRLLIFLEVKRFSNWWVTFDNTITLAELRKLAKWLSYLGSHAARVVHRMRLGQDALVFDYSPIKSKRGLLCIRFNRRLVPGRKKASGEYHTLTYNFVMFRFSRPELKRIAAGLCRELSKRAPKRLMKFSDTYKPVRIAGRAVH